MERPAVGGFQFRIVVRIDNGTVVFVDKYHYLSTCLLIDFPNQTVEAARWRIIWIGSTVLFLPFVQSLAEDLVQVFGCFVSSLREVQTQDRMLGPLIRLQAIDCQAAEQLALGAEIAFHRGDEQALAETTGPTQEEILPE